MRYRTILIAAAVILYAAAAAAAQKTDQQKATAAGLDWLAGCWEMSVPEQKMTITEIWMKPAAGTILGISRTVVDGKTVGYESMRIAEGVDGVTFFARPSSALSETPFRLVRFAAKEAEFENPENDFPQRIIYRRNKADRLSARIEASMSGEERSMDFPYKSISCE